MIVQRHHTENYLLFERFYSVFPELDPLLEERERYFSDDLEERLFALHPHKHFKISKTVYEEEIRNGNIIRIGDGNADIYRLDQKSGKWINANGKEANPTAQKRITSKIEATRANRVATVESAAAAGNFAGAPQTKQEFLDTANSYGAGTNMKDKAARQRQQNLAAVEQEGKRNTERYKSKSKGGKLDTQAMERDGVLNPLTAEGGKGATNNAGRMNRKQRRARRAAEQQGVFVNRTTNQGGRFQPGIEGIVNNPKNKPHYARTREAAQRSAYNNAVNNQATLRDLAQTNPTARNNIKEVLPPAPEPKPQFKAEVTGLQYVKPEPKPEVKPEPKPEVKPTPTKPRNINGGVGSRAVTNKAKRGLLDSFYKNGKLTTAGKIGAGVAAATALGGGLYAYSHHKDKQ